MRSALLLGSDNRQDRADPLHQRQTDRLTVTQPHTLPIAASPASHRLSFCCLPLSSQDTMFCVVAAFGVYLY